MKIIFLQLSLFVLALSSCQKSLEFNPEPATGKTPASASVDKPYVLYSIAKGSQYCDKNDLKKVSYQQLAFLVKFDSSAIYQTVDPHNQNDINKLYGFSDNNTSHHVFSARFGWRWSDNALRLFGYIYNNSVMSFTELGTIAIGAENDCSITVTASTYIFMLNGQTKTMPRASTTPKAEGYKLYPYFGGDEMAPHNVSIRIKEL